MPLCTSPDALKGWLSCGFVNVHFDLNKKLQSGDEENRNPKGSGCPVIYLFFYDLHLFLIFFKEYKFNKYNFRNIVALLFKENKLTSYFNSVNQDRWINVHRTSPASCRELF